MAKNKKNASDLAVINKKYFGSEPVSFDYSYDAMMGAYTFYNYMCDLSDAREYLVKYLLDNHRRDEAKSINSLKECWIPTTAAWIARVISNGNDVPDTSIDFMNRKIKEALSHKIEDEDNPKPSVQSFISDKSNDVIANIEDIIDSGYDSSFSYYNYFKTHELSANILRKVKDYYLPLLNEYESISVDRDLKEGYRFLTKKDIAIRVDYLKKMFSDIDTIINNKKQMRKKPVRTKTVKSKKINLLDFQYMKEDVGNKLVSVDPSKLIDKREVWLYNTKYNALSVLYSDEGFSIKGTTIHNITDKSVSKKIGASKTKVLTRVMTDTKVQLRKLMGDIKSAAQEATGRTNENVLILRVF